MTNYEALTPYEIDAELARLDGEYNKILARRERVIGGLRRTDGQRAVYYSRKPTFVASVEETVESVTAKLAEGKLAAWEREGAQRELDQLVAIEAEEAANRAETVPFTTEYDRRPWQRYFLVPGGKIHSGMWCQGGSIRWSTLRGWQPELSGNTVEQAVAELGSGLCTKCFPGAPVDVVLTPEQKGYCAGSGKYYVDGTISRNRRWAKCSHCETTQSVTSTGKIRAHKQK